MLHLVRASILLQEIVQTIAQGFKFFLTLVTILVVYSEKGEYIALRHVLMVMDERQNQPLFLFGFMGDANYQCAVCHALAKVGS